MDPNGVLKIADFGLARSYSVPMPSLTQEVVTLWYRAPEILLGKQDYNPNIDVWSAGCILAEMLKGQVLFQGQSEIDQIFKIFHTMGLPTMSDWPDFTTLPNYKPSFPRFTKKSFAQIFPPIE